MKLREAEDSPVWQNHKASSIERRSVDGNPFRNRRGPQRLAVFESSFFHLLNTIRQEQALQGSAISERICAAEGVPVPTLVIFPLMPEPALKAACDEKQRLYLHKPDRGFSVVVRNGRRELLGTAISLETMAKRRVYPESGNPPAWGDIPEILSTERFSNYPNEGLLSMGTELSPDSIREHIAREMKQPDGAHDRYLIQRLRAYSELFSHGKWLSPSEREWLKRPELDYA